MGVDYMKNNTDLNIKFESDYILRNNRSITSIPDIALTEFVANAWDAGAFNVTISISGEEDKDKCISIEDDGTGMTEEEFSNRWMTLNYDRQKNQGRTVEFPQEIQNISRIAFGHNGVGRHGMFCFNNQSYKVETWKDGKCNVFTVSKSTGSQPFTVSKDHTFDKIGHGTIISTSIEKNYPDIIKMRDIISARYLYDPNFTVRINGMVISLEDYTNVLSVTELKVNSVNLHITVIDTTKTSTKMQQHGIAFWICGRLVGQPSWIINRNQILDGRTKAAKRYTIIVQTDDLVDDVLPDWTGFTETSSINQFFVEFVPHIRRIVNELMKGQINDIRQSVISETIDKLDGLTTLEQRELSTFIETVTENSPMVNPDYLKTAVEAVIAMEKSRNGQKLLSQISSLSSEEIDKLAELLDNWDINDVLTVMDEIDRRIRIIEAISRCCDRKETDELHTLHPLILSSRWLFGTEFDSPMFTSNKTLNSVIKTLFQESKYDKSCISNLSKRPDIVMLDNGTFGAVCTERIDNEMGTIMKPDQILIVELKRGGYEIGYDETSQALNYMRQIKKSGQLHKDSNIHAFVVGASIGDIDPHQTVDSGILDVITYSQLVDTAHGKLFRLREKLQEHYDSIDDKSLVENALKDAQYQTKISSN